MKYKYKGTTALQVGKQIVRKPGDVIDVKGKFSHKDFEVLKSENKSEKRSKK